MGLAISAKRCPVVALSVLLGCFLLLGGLVGCTPTEHGLKSEANQPETSVYDQDSWRQIIPEECRAYFDGCNNCRRNPETGIAACTRKACMTYTKPYCLDDQESSKNTGGQKNLKQTIRYACEGGKGFTVSYGEYRSGDQRLRLNKDQVMFSDHQSRMARQLKRVPSASGERYSDGSLTLFAKGDEAFVKNGEAMLYVNCRKE
jgi:membrane-bound inhibitor of C-type lysozyme